MKTQSVNNNRLRLWFRPAPALLAAVFMLCCAISACTSDQETGRHDSPGAPGSEPVTLRLKWLFNASSAGEIWAEKRGFFKRAGLDVTIREGGAEQDAITDIEMGRALFGTASADRIIQAVSKGADIVVLAQIFQENPLQWIYCPDITRSIKTPDDLRGLTVGITYGGNDEAIFNALMEKYHLSEREINLYAVHYDYAPFWKGEVNLWPIYRNIEGIILSRKMAANNHRAAFFEPGRHGIKFVANSIVTSRRTYRSRPELVKTFVTVFMAAWKDALAEKNRAQVAAAVHCLDTDTPMEIIMQQLGSTEKFILPAGVEAGRIDMRAWEQTAKIMLDQRLTEHKIDLSTILDPHGICR